MKITLEAVLVPKFGQTYVELYLVGGERRQCVYYSALNTEHRDFKEDRAEQLAFDIVAERLIRAFQEDDE